MLHSLRQLFSHVSRRRRWQLAALIVLMVIGAAAEMATLGAVVPVLALLTNPEVLAVNQRSTGNRPHRADAGTRIWSARAAGNSKVHYLALFNTDDRPTELVFDLSRLNLGNRTVACRDLWARRDLGPVKGSLRQTLQPHASVLLQLTA